MAWFRVDDMLPDHRKVRRLRGDRLPAMGLWTLCGAWSGRNLQDGFVPDDIVEDNDPDHIYAKRLVDVGLWERVMGAEENGYQFHDWGQANPTAAEVNAEREGNRIKTALYRDPDLVRAVRERDASRCRLCGVQVSWTDRRSLHAAVHLVLDHDQPLVHANVVTACRGCAKKKGNRSLRQARMSVLPPRSTGGPPRPDDPPAYLDPYLDTNQNETGTQPVESQNVRSSRPDPSPSTSRGQVPRSSTGDKRARKLAATAHSAAAHRLVNAYVAECAGIVPTDVKAELGPLVDGLIHDGLNDSQISETLTVWGSKGLAPSLLPSVAHQLINGRGPRNGSTPAPPTPTDPDDPMTFDEDRLNRILGFEQPPVLPADVADSNDPGKIKAWLATSYAEWIDSRRRQALATRPAR